MVVGHSDSIGTELLCMLVEGNKKFTFNYSYECLSENKISVVIIRIVISFHLNNFI